MNSRKTNKMKNLLMIQNKSIKYVFIFGICSLLCIACTKSYIPRPYGYQRIALPDTAYTRLDTSALPYSFELSDNAQVIYKTAVDEKYWIDIVYPTLNAKVYCSYRPIENNLSILNEESREFVYKHAVRADAIPEQGFENPTQHVYGVFYELYGNTASPIQVVLTDSTTHFFRAALYFNTTPNQDSIAPVLEYIQGDIIRIVESFEWR